MINVNQITAQLARMPDQALQQYAQMHKTDPYTLSLALAESNRRRQLRQGAQMQAPEQPKVVDQALQSMAAPMPEDVGIGQLPAGNMNFAEGGIVAFADGGDVPRYQSQGLVQYSGAYGGAPLLGGTTGYEGMGLGEFSKTLYVQALRKLGLEDKAAKLTPAEQRAAETEANKMAVTQGRTYRPENYGVTEPAPLYPGARDYRTTGAALTADSGTAPTSDTGARPPATARPQGPELLGGSGAAAPTGQSIYSLASTPSTYQREFEQFMPQGKVADPFEADVRAQGAAEEKAARDFAARRKQQLEGLGALGAEQEKRLKTREEKLGKQEGELSGMALLQAGFAMMSGASPNALQNIGVGAQAGLKKYGEGIERLDAAREKIDDAFGRLEIARRSEKMLTDKELADVERDADKVAAQTKRDVINSARTAYGLSTTQAGKMFDAYVADKRLGAELGSREKLSREEMQNRLAAAKVTAGAQQGLYQALGSAAPGSPLLKGYEMAKQEGQIPRLYAEYTKMVSDELKGAKFLQQYPTFDAYLAGMGGGRGGFVTPPANAPVLRAPGT